MWPDFIGLGIYHDLTFFLVIRRYVPLRIGTVDQAQDRRHDIQLLGLVTSGERLCSLGFCLGPKRMRTALRAKIGVLIFGDKDMKNIKHLSGGS